MVNFKKVDRTRCSQKGNKKEARIIDFIHKSEFFYTIHRHIDYPDTWLLSCREMNIKNINLKDNNLDIAENRARIYIYKKLEETSSLYRKIMEDLSED